MIDAKNFFDQPVKNVKVTYKNIIKIATGEGDDYATGCFLDYIYFKNYYKMIAVDLGKQQAVDADPKAIQEINFTANLDSPDNTRLYFILEEAKKLFMSFHKVPLKFCECNIIKRFNFYHYKNHTIQQFKCKAIKFTP